METTETIDMATINIETIDTDTIGMGVINTEKIDTEMIDTTMMNMETIDTVDIIDTVALIDMLIILTTMHEQGEVVRDPPGGDLEIGRAGGHIAVVRACQEHRIRPLYGEVMFQQIHRSS